MSAIAAQAERHGERNCPTLNCATKEGSNERNKQMKQKIMVYAIAIVACAIGFPFYWGFTHGPDSTIEKMFDGMAIIGEPGYCVDASVKEQVQLGLGAIIMQNGLTKDVESDIVKTEKKDDGTATVSVKLSSGNKSAMVEFSLKKEEGFLGDWKITGIAKGK